MKWIHMKCGVDGLRAILHPNENVCWYINLPRYCGEEARDAKEDLNWRMIQGGTSMKMS